MWNVDGRGEGGTLHSNKMGLYDFVNRVVGIPEQGVGEAGLEQKYWGKENSTQQ